MKINVQCYIAFFVLCISIVYCKSPHYQAQKNIFSNCINIFEFKYKATIRGRTRDVSKSIYVGESSSFKIMNGRQYNELVFGDTPFSVVAFVRQDSVSIRYIDLYSLRHRNENNLPVEDRPFLYFNKKINERWKIDIDSSLFGRQYVIFKGQYVENGDTIYIYDLEKQKDYFSSGGYICKIFYSRKTGFVKFVVQTHWFSVEVKKKK